MSPRAPAYISVSNSIYAFICFESLFKLTTNCSSFWLATFELDWDDIDSTTGCWLLVLFMFTDGDVRVDVDNENLQDGYWKWRGYFQLHFHGEIIRFFKNDGCGVGLLLSSWWHEG